MTGWTSDGVTQKLIRGLDAASLQQRLHAHNVANVNTPGFKRSYVSFEEALKTAQKDRTLSFSTTHPKHLSFGQEAASVEAAVKVDHKTSMRPDKNNVDVDREMADMATNQLYYHALSQQLGERLGTIRYVINEGRR